jgi:hypothetical protein
MMKTAFLNKNLLYGILLLVLLFNLVAQACGFGFSFFSLWDESYLLLKCKEAYLGMAKGSNLWNIMAVKWFPYLDLTNKIQSSWASLILVVFAVINATIVALFVFDKRNFVKYLSLFLLAMMPAILGHYAAEMPNRMGWGTEMNYVVMESFLLLGSLSAFLYYYFKRNTALSWLALLVVGVFCGLAFFVILPSTCLVFAGYLVLLVAINGKNRAECVKAVLLLGLGVCLALLYIHFFVADLGIVWIEMGHTAQYITKSGLGYTPLSFIMQVGKLFILWIQCALYVLGAYVLAGFVENRFRYVGGLLYVVFILFALIYLHPRYHYSPSSLLFSSVVILPFVRTSNNLVAGSQKKPEWFVTAFLVLFPVFASIGTNTSLYGRMGCFLCSWVFLWLIKEECFKEKAHWYISLGAILTLLLPISYNNIRNYHQHNTIYTTHFTHGTDNAAELWMSPEQKAYFERIHVLFDQYGYQPDKSVVFASYLDYCTIYVFDAKLSNGFHMKGFFPFKPKEDFLLPDFIIMSEDDIDFFHLEDFSWGWPENYDKYFIGTPETVCQKFIGYEGKKRWLYCRKNVGY